MTPGADINAPSDRHSHRAVKSFPRELGAADAVSALQVVAVHGDRHLEKLAGERERALVVRDRRAPIASDVEAVPGDKIEEARAVTGRGRYAIDQQRELARRRHRLRQATHAHAKPAILTFSRAFKTINLLKRRVPSRMWLELFWRNLRYDEVI